MMMVVEFVTEGYTVEVEASTPAEACLLALRRVEELLPYGNLGGGVSWFPPEDYLTYALVSSGEGSIGMVSADGGSTWREIE